MKQNSKDILDIKIVTHKDGKDKVVEFQYRKSSINEKTMALDVLLQAQDTILPNLASISFIEFELFSLEQISTDLKKW